MYYEVLRGWKKIKLLQHQILKDDVFIWEVIEKVKKEVEIPEKFTKHELQKMKWPDLRSLYSKVVWPLKTWLSKTQVIDALLNNK